jgi:hypothetical protein
MREPTTTRVRGADSRLGHRLAGGGYAHGMGLHDCKPPLDKRPIDDTEWMCPVCGDVWDVVPTEPTNVLRVAERLVSSGPPAQVDTGGAGTLGSLLQVACERRQQSGLGSS